MQAVRHSENHAGLCRVELSFADTTPSLLGWLKSQTVFPQAFWQHRDQDFCFAALGFAAQFDDLVQAQQFSQQHQVQLVGGVQFEGKVRFMLPRLNLVKNSQKLTACLAFFAHEKAEMLEFLANLAEPSSLNMVENQRISQTAACDFPYWQANIEQAISAIQQQEFDKVVLANATTLTFQDPISPYDLLAQSQLKNLGCFHFLWAENCHQTFIGSSPERLYLREDRQFFTEALAGTVAVTDDPIETEQNALWLLNDHKNRYENWLVVDDICHHLADCATDIQVGDAEIKRLRNVQHLRRQIHTVLAEKVNDADCLAKIHPTAAVAGLPRKEAQQFIRQHEGFERGWYAGTLGHFSPEKAEFCVTLRSAQICGNEMTIYAGAGIVAESDPQSEWQEINRKALAMASLIECKRSEN